MANPLLHISPLISIVSPATDLFSLQTLCFVDAGCFEGGFTCWGFCAIDPAGTVIYSASRKEFITVEPLIPEALGVRWGLQMATSLGLSDFSVISDALLVISCLQNIFVVATCLLSKTGGIS